MNIATISREELQAKLERGDDFKLVMTLHEWAFNKAHIPGSINVTSPGQAARELNMNDKIVVYCSDEACIASQIAYRALTEAGYRNVRRYAGGLSDWEAAGHPLEGTPARPLSSNATHTTAGRVRPKSGTRPSSNSQWEEATAACEPTQPDP